MVRTNLVNEYMRSSFKKEVAVDRNFEERMLRARRSTRYP